MRLRRVDGGFDLVKILGKWLSLFWWNQLNMDLGQLIQMGRVCLGVIFNNNFFYVIILKKMSLIN